MPYNYALILGLEFAKVLASNRKFKLQVSKSVSMIISIVFG